MLQVVYHDVSISTLVGADVERVKCLARSETTIVKVHSSTSTVLPMFVFYTSNERLFKHTLSGCRSRQPKQPRRGEILGWDRTLLSHAETVANKRISPENLDAIRCRFLEMYIDKAPQQAKEDLENCGTFSRDHFIFGTFTRTIQLLEHYQLGDFHSAFLPAYVLSGLAKNLPKMEQSICQQLHLDGCQQNHVARLNQLFKKYNFHPPAKSTF